MILYAAYGTPVIREDGSIDNLRIGLSWQKKNGQKFIKPQALRAAAGCAGAKSITVGNIRGKLCA